MRWDRKCHRGRRGGGFMGLAAIAAGIGLIFLCISPLRWLLVGSAVALIAFGALLLFCD